MKNRIKSLWYAVQCLMLVASTFACGGEDGGFDDRADLELGQDAQAIKSQITNPLGGASRFLGETNLQTGGGGKQAPPPNDSAVILLPYTVSWSVRFTGFTPAQDTDVRNAFGIAESFAVDTAHTGSTFFNVAAGANAKIKVQLLSGGSVLQLPSGQGVDIQSFFSVVCTTGTLLSEPGGSVVGTYAKISTANDACSIGVRYALLDTFCSGGATCRNRVLGHGAGYVLAQIAGSGTSSTMDPDYITARNVNTAKTKQLLPTGQQCLMKTWTEPGLDAYKICNTAGCPLCAALPFAY